MTYSELAYITYVAGEGPGLDGYYWVDIQAPLKANRRGPFPSIGEVVDDMKVGLTSLPDNVVVVDFNSSQVGVNNDTPEDLA